MQNSEVRAGTQADSAYTVGVQRLVIRKSSFLNTAIYQLAFVPIFGNINVVFTEWLL